MKAPQFREMRIADLEFATYNPKRRTSAECIRDLVDSMSRVGLLYPVLVTDKGVVIDGHRRLSAAKELGWETIACVVTTAEPDETYATVNATSRKMGGNDALSVWLKRPNAVTAILRSRFDSMMTILGAKRVDKLCRAGYSNKLYQQAVQVARYCDRGDDQELVCQMTDWMMEHRVTAAVKQAMSTNQSSEIILRAMRRNKPLVMKMAVAD